MSQSKEPLTSQEADQGPSLSEQSRVRREKLQKLREKSLDYPHGYRVSHTPDQIFEKWSEEKDSDVLRASGSYQLAGRISFIRSFGKAGFVKIQSSSGSIQFYVAKNKLEQEDDFEVYKGIDLGDIVWAEGQLFRTKTGELSLEAKSFKILSKCLHTPPEKFHGLSDIEERYRKRYLDLMGNEESRKIFKERFELIQYIRNFFSERAFLEVETPMMHPLVSGAAAKPFVTHHNTLDRQLFLRIAPELYLKRLVVGGMEKVFELNRNFRNEGMSVRHNPEFTMLEFYWAYATYEDLMKLTEELISGACMHLHGKTSVEYQGTEIQYAAPWRRVSMEEAVQEYSSYKGALNDVPAMRDYLKAKKVELFDGESAGTLLTKIFEEEVEDKLIQPTFVTGYPVEVSPLARRASEKSPHGLDLTERFELFIFGREIANGFNELNDPDDQKGRFLKQLEEKESGNEETMDYDEDYIHALEYALPPTAGEGIGIDRLCMLLSNAASIRDVILFPQMREAGN